MREFDFLLRWFGLVLGRGSERGVLLTVWCMQDGNPHRR